MSSVLEAIPLRRISAWVTGTFIVVLSVYVGVALVVVSASWWQPLLLAPSMLAALWIATRWDTPVPPLIAAGVIVLGGITWALASWLAVSPVAAIGVSVAGAVTVSKLADRRGRFAALLVAIVLITGLLSLIDQTDQVMGYVLGAPMFTAVLVGVFWVNQIAWQLVVELDATRRAETELALVQERFRFATDLHDIQGHTLHVIKLKTALAERLVRADPAGAKDELKQVQVLIAETISQTRSLAYGQRKITPSGELENAKNLFEAAGIEVNVSRDGEPDSALDEYVSLVLREVTTNILRHSLATRVEIVLGSRGISIRNNGADPTATPELRGLADLQQRIASGGGTLTADRESDEFLTVAIFEDDESAVAGD